MSATYTVAAASDQNPAVTGDGYGEVIAVRGEFDLAVDGIGALVLNDVLQMVKLPAGHVPVDVIVDSDDLDSNATPTIALNVGIIGGDVDAFIKVSTIAQAGGIARMDDVAGARIASTQTERYVGITVSTAPATGATTGKIGLTLLYKAE